LRNGSNGIFCAIVQSASSDWFGISAYSGANNTDGLYLYGGQVNTGTLKPYFPTTDRLNVPRLTYQNGGGGCPSLLLEPQRTNSILYSQDFDNAYWSKQSGASVTANSAISPDGTQNADTINLVSGSTISRVEKGGISLSANTYLTFSVYLKNISLTSGQTFQLRFETLGFDLRGTIDLFNKTNKVSITGGTGTGYVSGTQSASISELSDGWLRCNITVQVGSLVVGTGTFYLITNVDANRSFYAWGIQYEAGAYPTTYIPTTTASATRVADASSLSSLNSKNITSSSAYTLFYDFGNLTNISNADLKLGNLGVYLFSNSWFLYDLSAGTILNNTSITGNKKIAITYSSGVLKAFANNTKLVTYNGTMTSDSWSAIPTNIIEIKEMLMFNTALTETEALALIQ
jgi:hypothetical protein